MNVADRDIEHECIQLRGKPLVSVIDAETSSEASRLRESVRAPKLAVLRVGERADDVSYERSVLKKCASLGVETEVSVLPGDSDERAYASAMERLASDDGVDGILPFRPLPPHLSNDLLKSIMPPSKDIDCISPLSMASIYDRSIDGCLPCTAEAAVELLKHWKIPLAGAEAVVIGRSLVVGRALALLLLDENCTVTICHSRTKDLQRVSSRADIVIAAMGRARSINAEYVRAGATVVDVGINDDGAGGICGDVDAASVIAKGARAISPVPGGVGGVTSSILIRNAVRAMKRRIEIAR